MFLSSGASAGSNCMSEGCQRVSARFTFAPAAGGGEGDRGPRARRRCARAAEGANGPGAPCRHGYSCESGSVRRRGVGGGAGIDIGEAREQKSGDDLPGAPTKRARLRAREDGFIMHQPAAARRRGGFSARRGKQRRCGGTTTVGCWTWGRRLAQQRLLLAPIMGTACRSAMLNEENADY